MKKIYLILLFLVCSIISFAQYPGGTQTIGNDSNIVKAKGGLQGRIIPIPYADTTAANLERIRQYAGAEIYTTSDNKKWYRNAALTAWLQYSSGSGSSINIYNSDGTLTSNRILSGSNIHSLTLDSLSAFNVASFNGAAYAQLQIHPTESSLRYHNSADNFVSVTNGLIQNHSEGSIYNEVLDSFKLAYSGTIPTVSSLSGYKLQARNVVSGAFVDYSGNSGNTIDVFGIAGQSNAVGNSTQPSLAPTPESGTAFQFYNGAISPAVEPIGNSNGSAWPAFAVTYYKLTGHLICFVPAGVNGSGMASVANSGHGTWDTTGTLYDTSVARINAALTALTTAGYTPIFKGILWDQGENDADFINRGAETQSTYNLAFAKLIKNYRLQFGKTISFNIFRTGFRTDTIQTGYLQVQSTQQTLANPDSLINIVFWNAAYFPSRSLMRDNYHYTQAGYNEMGRIGAEEFVNSGARKLQEQGANVYISPPEMIGIGTGLPASPIDIVNTGVAKEISLSDSLNNVIRIAIQNKQDGNTAGAGTWLYTSLGLRSQIVHTSLSSFIGSDILAINSTPGVGINSDSSDINLSTGAFTSNISLKSRLRIKNSGQIAIGQNVDPNASAIFDINSTTLGFLPPRMTTTQQNAISSPAAGLFIYNTDSSKHCYYTGSTWICYGNANGISTAINNTNVGSAQRLLEPSTQGIKTLSNTASHIQYDSSTSHQLNISFKNDLADPGPSAVYGNQGSTPGWYSVPLLDTTNRDASDSTVAIWITALKKMVFINKTQFGNNITVPGNSSDVVINRNGALAAPGSDSLTYDNNGLNNKYLYRVNGNTVVYKPDNTTFLNTIFYGSLPASLSHTTGITGQYVTGIGLLAGNANTTGASDVFVGSRAGQANNTGTNDVFVGDGAGIANQGGNQNTAVGMGSLQTNSAGNNVTVMGFEGLKSSTASTLTGMGYRVMHENTSAGNNAAFGDDALYQNQTGIQNAVFGPSALTGTASNSASGNSAFGYHAMFTNTTGGQNIAMGDSAAYNSAAHVRFIVIGTGLQDNGDYSLNLGGAIFGTGMTAHGTSTAGSIGIITTAPNSTLHVNGSFAVAYVAKTGSYTLTSTDEVVEVTTGTNNQTLPTAVGITGREYTITNSGTGVVSVLTTSSQTFVNVSGTPTSLTLNQFQSATVVSNGANWLLTSTR